MKQSDPTQLYFLPMKQLLLTVDEPHCKHIWASIVAVPILKSSTTRRDISDLRLKLKYHVPWYVLPHNLVFKGVFPSAVFLLKLISQPSSVISYKCLAVLLSTTSYKSSKDKICISTHISVFFFLRLLLPLSLSHMHKKRLLDEKWNKSENFLQNPPMERFEIEIMVSSFPRFFCVPWQGAVLGVFSEVPNGYWPAVPWALIKALLCIWLPHRTKMSFCPLFRFSNIQLYDDILSWLTGSFICQVKIIIVTERQKAFDKRNFPVSCFIFHEEQKKTQWNCLRPLYFPAKRSGTCLHHFSSMRHKAFNNVH